MLADTVQTYLPHGWRAKIAFMLPASCLVYEQEFAAVVASIDGVIGIPARLPIEATDASGLAGMNEHITTAARQLASTDPDVIVYMCTSGSFMDGVDGDAAIRGQIAAITGKPVTSTSLAVASALAHLDVEGVVVLSPYDDDIARREDVWLSAAGFRVVAHRNLDIIDNLHRGSFPPREALRYALELDWSTADAIFLSCANVPYGPIVEKLSTLTKRHVITSSLATTWHALRAAGIEAPIMGRET